MKLLVPSFGEGSVRFRRGLAAVTRIGQPARVSDGREMFTTARAFACGVVIISDAEI
jgi:hypothetical protein